MMARKAKYFVGMWRRCATIRTFFNLAKGLLMKKWLFIIAGVLIISACANKEAYLTEL